MIRVKRNPKGALAGCGKKTFHRFIQMLAFRTLRKRRLLSLPSLPPGETRVREQAAEIPFFRSLLGLLSVLLAGQLLAVSPRDLAKETGL